MRKRTELAWRRQRDTRRRAKYPEIYIDIKSFASSAAVVATLNDMDIEAFIEEMTHVRHGIIRPLALETAADLEPDGYQPSELEADTQTLDPENTRAALKALITLANSQCDAGQARIQFYNVDVDDTNVGHAGPVDTPLEGWLTDYFGHFLECRKCGCTETRPCVDGRGPCWWVEVDLCSHCAEPTAAVLPSEELEP